MKNEIENKLSHLNAQAVIASIVNKDNKELASFAKAVVKETEKILILMNDK